MTAQAPRFYVTTREYLAEIGSMYGDGTKAEANATIRDLTMGGDDVVVLYGRVVEGKLRADKPGRRWFVITREELGQLGEDAGATRAIADECFARAEEVHYRDVVMLEAREASIVIGPLR